MKRLLSIALVAVVAFIAMVQPAAAWGGPLDGRPTLLGPGSPTGYYLWTDGGLHLRASSLAGLNTFTGRITTDGVIRDARKVSGEGRDWIQQLGPGELTFSFATHSFNDGIDFHVIGGSYVRFDLSLNGYPISTDRIHLGRFNHHPLSNPVILPR